MVADYLKRNKPGAQIVALDANQDITAEKENFSHAFLVMYGSNLTYRTGRLVKSVTSVAGQPGGLVVVDIVVKDALGQDVVMGKETYEAEVLNVIPPHRAGVIVQNLGLADERASRRWTDAPSKARLQASPVSTSLAMHRRLPCPKLGMSAIRAPRFALTPSCGHSVPRRPTAVPPPIRHASRR